ncbi:dynein light chain Tctex-type protein 2B [Lepeophtheirus salmonis]|uniref:dynein light chain Tctex-type protein 2B n=1 Tax=Lepeophtheirus salmonis TaxID=72036 RepID=UPI001AE37DA1|nr:dynein light chain Tctex-type protein 2B-like [Lepeophtheirus salmonis]XP_040583725.1 dynein light chain Tctex-type protein 2B-like [Lepeophtheirus salmonis]
MSNNKNKINGRKEEEEEAKFQIRPSFENKFKPGAVKDIIHNVLIDVLNGKAYAVENVSTWTKNIADSIKHKIKLMGYERYKIIVEVVIGEQRGEGVRMGSRCLWDSETDNYASDVFINDSLFCAAAAFGIYYY